MSTQQVDNDKKVEELLQMMSSLHIEDKQTFRAAIPCFMAIKQMLDPKTSTIHKMFCGSEYHLQCKDERPLDQVLSNKWPKCDFAWTGQTAADLDFWDLRYPSDIDRFNSSGKTEDFTRHESMVKIFRDSTLSPTEPGPYRVPETNVYLKYLIYDEYIEEEQDEQDDYTTEELLEAIASPYPQLERFVTFVRNQGREYIVGPRLDWHYHPDDTRERDVSRFVGAAVWIESNYDDETFRRRFPNSPEGTQAAVLVKHMKIPTMEDFQTMGFYPISHILAAEKYKKEQNKKKEEGQ